MPHRPSIHVLMCIVLATVLAGFAFASQRDGDRAAERGEYDVAVREYRAALERQAENVQLLIDLARSETYLAGAMEGDEAVQLYEAAAEHARQAIALDPEEPEAHMELARALGRLAQFKGIFESLNLAATVREALETTLELDPSHGGAHHALALWHHNVPWIAGGRGGEVAPLFEKAIELEPEAVSHRVAYAEILIERGEREYAREQLEAALAIDDASFRSEVERQRARELLEEHF